jgi:hypothetical protein
MQAANQNSKRNLKSHTFFLKHIKVHNILEKVQTLISILKVSLSKYKVQKKSRHDLKDILLRTEIKICYKVFNKKWDNREKDH